MLRDRTILVISPQSWGEMKLSKHHYAMELAKRGNRVYFLNPPEQDRWGWGSKINISASTEQPNLFIISHILFFPYNFRFHLPVLFKMLMHFQVMRLLKRMIFKIDILWSFDIGNIYPFDLFPEQPIKIFHPVDEPLLPNSIKAASGADYIFSVTNEILEKYTHFKIPKFFINHGVSEDFIKSSELNKAIGIPIKVGLSGNLLRNDIDREILLKIIRNNPSIIFECWGSYKISQSNIGGSEDKDTALFIETIKREKNVILHGVLQSKYLAKEFKRMDAFLICYDVQRDQSKGTNYHKVMEYLSSGRVIISNNITTYSDRLDLVVMVKERNENSKLPALFNNVIENLGYFNDASNQKIRFHYAKANLYSEQINRIENIIYAA